MNFQELKSVAKLNLPVSADSASVYWQDPTIDRRCEDMIASTLTGWGEGYPERNRARAELIALALNHHEELVGALRKAEEALHDILGAAENGEPYSSEELQVNFITDYNLIHAVLRNF